MVNMRNGHHPKGQGSSPVTTTGTQRGKRSAEFSKSFETFFLKTRGRKRKKGKE
jgi:hypothetical protein